MSTVTRHALRVYAALTELKGQDADVLDALIPFFEPVLTLMNGKIFDPYVFSAGIRKLYGWRFTGDIAGQFIPRLERKGLLRKSAQARTGSIWVVEYKQLEKAETTSSIVVALEKIIDDFSNFPPRVTDLLTYHRSREELKDILIRFLVSMDTNGGAYTPELGDLDPNAEAREILIQLEEGGRPLSSEDRYMAARFVDHIVKNKPEHVPYLSRLASIALLTEVVEDFLRPTHPEVRVNLTIVLDAPLALDLLGCSGKALQDDISAIVDALKKIGVIFIVFPNSCMEIQHNLRSMLALPPERRHGYTHNALVKREIAQDFVMAVANNPERALENIGIQVRQITINSYPGSHKFFTTEQYDDFYSSISWGNDVSAKEHDATCTALIMRLREGKQSSDVFKCRYIMVTRNSTFVQRSRKYCLQSRMVQGNQEGPVIHQRELATIAWLRTGLGGSEAVPRSHLVATCDRILQVRPEVKNALAMQLAKLTPERLSQFNLLMQDAKSVQRLADETLNNEAIVTSENAERLLQVMREATAEELKAVHEQRLTEERAEAAKLHKLSEAEISSLSEQLEEARQREASAKERTDRQVDLVIQEINRTAFYIEAFFVITLLVLAALGGVNHFTEIVKDSHFWNVISLLAAALGVIRLIFALLERPMPGLASILNRLSKSMIRRRLRALGLDDYLAFEDITIKAGRAHRSQ